MSRASGEVPEIVFFGFTSDAWGVIFAAINTVVVLVGIAFAVYNLRLMRKQQYFEAFTAFMSELASSEMARFEVYNSFSRIKDYGALTEEDERPAIDTINFLNRTATLIESRMLPKFPVLSLMHTSIIRCWYSLETYAQWREAKYGGRYGRRVSRLDQMARRFHDCRAHQRIHPIQLFRQGEDPIVIYKCEVSDGVGGMLAHVRWRLTDLLGRY